MKQVDHEQLAEVFQIHYEKRKPLFIHGTTGIGKSDTVEDQVRGIADEQEREFVKWHDLSDEQKENITDRKDEVHIFYDIRLAAYDSSDINGIPSLQEDVLRFMPPEWVDTICTDGIMATVFLDEANLAPPLVQSALYQLVLDRKVGSRSISDDVYVTAAGNREGKDRANIHGMAAPLSDRFGHIELEPPEAGDPDEGGNWTEWALDNGIREEVVSYLISGVGEEHLFTFEDDNFGGEHTFATPRSWETLSDLIEDDHTPDKIGTLASVWVGEGVARELKAFLELRLDAQIDDYLNNPEKGRKLNEKDFNEIMAVLTGVAAEFRDSPDETIAPVIKLADNIEEDSKKTFLLRTCRQYNSDAFINILTSPDERKELEGWDEATWKRIAEDLSTHFM